MFEQPGMTIGDLAWIRRDQFVYYVEMAHALGDPSDWPRFRRDLLQALTAAFSLDVDDPDGAWTCDGNRTRASNVLDRVATRHHPASNWGGFFDELWASRGLIRPDLAPAADTGRPPAALGRAPGALMSQPSSPAVDSLDDCPQEDR